MWALNMAAIEVAYCAAKSPRLDRLTTMSLSMAPPPSRRSRPTAPRGGSSRKTYASLCRLGLRATRSSRAGGRDRPSRPTRLSFLGPVGPELLQVGPQIGNVLVVLDADERHAGARHLLHRRTDVFVEGLLVPGDAGRFVGRGIIESLEGAGLAAVDAVERGSELDLGLRSDVVARGAQTLEHLLAGGRILRQRRPARTHQRNDDNHACSHHLLLFSPLTLLPSAPYQGPRPDWMTGKRPHINAQVGWGRPAMHSPRRSEWRYQLAVSTAQSDNAPRCRDARRCLRASAVLRQRCRDRAAEREGTPSVSHRCVTKERPRVGLHAPAGSGCARSPRTHRRGAAYYRPRRGGDRGRRGDASLRGRRADRISAAAHGGGAAREPHASEPGARFLPPRGYQGRAARGGHVPVRRRAAPRRW